MIPRPSLLSLLGAFLTALLLVLSFPRPGLDLLVWVALVPLLWAAGRTSRGEAFLLGWAAGTAWSLVSLDWLAETIRLFGGIPFPANQGFILLLAAVLGLWTGLFALAARWTASRGGAAPFLLLPPLWLALEMARSWFPAPFPWLLLGTAAWDRPELLPALGAYGSHGLSFLMVLYGVGAWRALEALPGMKAREILKPLGVSAAAALLALLPGFASPSGRAKPVGGMESGVFQAAIIQGNFPQDLKWSEGSRDEALSVYLDLTRQAAAKRAKLVVWPETAMTFYVQADKGRDRLLRELVEETGIHLVFGAPGFSVPEGGGDPLLFNSAFHYAPGGVTRRYDKTVLVPFGEYVPLGRLLPFVRKLAEGAGDFTPGRWEGPFPTPLASGALICFESAFPSLGRRASVGGARILLVLTNDAWYGTSWGPYQHLALAGVRAAENGLPVLRAANTGISAAFDPGGRMAGSVGLFQRGYILADVPFSGTGTKTTLYRRWGDWIAIPAGLMVIFFFFPHLHQGRFFRWKSFVRRSSGPGNA